MEISDSTQADHSEWEHLLHSIAQRRRSAGTTGTGYTDLQRAWLLFVADAQDAWVTGYQERLDQEGFASHARHSFRYPRIFTDEDLDVEVPVATIAPKSRTIDPLFAETAPYKLDKIARIQTQLRDGGELRGPFHLIERGNSGIYMIDDGMHRIARALELGWTSIEVEVASGRDASPILPSAVHFDSKSFPLPRATLPDGRSQNVSRTTVAFYENWRKALTSLS